MKCDRKVGLREITGAKNKHPRAAMGDRRSNVDQKKWGYISALCPNAPAEPWGQEKGKGMGWGQQWEQQWDSSGALQCDHCLGQQQQGAAQSMQLMCRRCKPRDKPHPSMGVNRWGHTAMGSTVPKQSRALGNACALSVKPTPSLPGLCAGIHTQSPQNPGAAPALHGHSELPAHTCQPAWLHDYISLFPSRLEHRKPLCHSFTQGLHWYLINSIKQPP